MPFSALPPSLGIGGGGGKGLLRPSTVFHCVYWAPRYPVRVCAAGNASVFLLIRMLRARFSMGDAVQVPVGAGTCRPSYFAAAMSSSIHS